MDFLDGLLIRDSNISKAESIAVKDKLYEMLEHKTSRRFTMKQIKEEIEGAIVNLDNPILNKTKAVKTTNKKTGLTSDIPLASAMNEVLKINNDIIMSGLWEIKSKLSNELFTYLQSVFQRKSKPKGDIVRPMEEGKEATLKLLINSIKTKSKLSASLQNKLFDLGMLNTDFLMALEDMATTGERKVHPNIFKELMEIKNKPQGADSSLEFAEYKPTKLYEEVMVTLEKLSGKVRPDRKAMAREFKLIRNKKNSSVYNLIRLLNADRYRVQGRGALADYKKISEALGDNNKHRKSGLYKDWDNMIGDFKNVFEYEDSITGELVEEIEYNTQNFDTEIDAIWALRDDKDSVNYEDIRGKAYVKKIKKLEELYYKIRTYYKALVKLGTILSEKKLLVEEVMLDIPKQQESLEKEFAAIKNGVKDYAKITEQIKRELKEAKAERETDKRLSRMKTDAGISDDVYDVKEQPKTKEQQEKQYKLQQKEEENKGKVNPKSMNQTDSKRNLTTDQWLEQMGVKRDKLKDILDRRNKE
jgi:hypothetical protein